MMMIRIFAVNLRGCRLGPRERGPTRDAGPRAGPLARRAAGARHPQRDAGGPGQDYVRTARAKGLSERAVTAGHALKNALLPIVTVIGLQLGGLLGGAVMTETVFAWPGVGTLILDAILRKDYPGGPGRRESWPWPSSRQHVARSALRISGSAPSTGGDVSGGRLSAAATALVAGATPATGAVARFWRARRPGRRLVAVGRGAGSRPVLRAPRPAAWTSRTARPAGVEPRGGGATRSAPTPSAATC